MANLLRGRADTDRSVFSHETDKSVYCGQGHFWGRGGQGVKTTLPPRERLLDTAGKLFFRHGFQAVGIDRILAESGVAKMTLYRHFSSKDALIDAYLQRADQQFWTWAEHAMAPAEGAEAKLHCLFEAAAMAFPEMDHPGHRRALQHKERVLRRLAALSREASLRDPEGLARALALLLDGAWVAARVFGPGENSALELGAAAAALLDAHRPSATRSAHRK